MKRKEAREYIIKHCNPHRDTGTRWDDAMECAIKALEEPERKKGEWIITSEFEDCYYAKCNQCNTTQVFYFNKPLTNFCPNCGADMRGEQDDTD